MRIHEVPVDWTDDPESSVDIIDTAITDLKGVARMWLGSVSGRLPVPVVGSRSESRYQPV